jgi:hypothetical protein
LLGDRYPELGGHLYLSRQSFFLQPSLCATGVALADQADSNMLNLLSDFDLNQGGAPLLAHHPRASQRAPGIVCAAQKAFTICPL